MSPSKSGIAVDNLLMELHALDSKMKVVAQRMKIIEKNEQIIGKTLISHNKKLKELERKGGISGPAPSTGREELRGLIDEFKRTSVDVHNTVEKAKAEIQKNKDLIAKIQVDIRDMKYILDSVNPVAYVTIDQVEDLVKEKVERELKK